ncbi:MAG: DUF58 domain-containing protein [Candidatus Omnitrophica bacterium]|nr:DUF58 domain-containing protein [Candidatus Omnitrophota bacterium]
MSSDLFHIDPQQLAAITDLQLLARIVVEGFMSGLHASPHFGASVEFAQYRPYVQGDDPRFVDWSLYARTDRLHSKQFQAETNLRCMILLDCSASMSFSSMKASKFDYARMLSACLAMMLFRQKDAFGLLAFHEEIEAYIPPRMNQQHFNHMLLSLNDLAPSRKTNFPAILQKANDLIPHRGMLIIISDFLHPFKDIIELITLLSVRHRDVLIFSISDPMEEDLSLNRSVTLIDSETNKEAYVVPDFIRKEYQENRRRHFSQVREECFSLEIDYGEFLTTEPLDRGLFQFLSKRKQILLSRSAHRTRTGGGS